MYLTPIFYPIESLPEKLQFLIKAFNPLYYYIAQFRDLVYYGQIPGPRVMWGGWFMAFVMLAIGLWAFKRKQYDFILFI